MSKRGQGMSMQTIVFAVVSLIVLVVVLSIFVFRTNSSADEITECTSKGNICARQCGEGFISVPLECPDDLPKCCSKSDYVEPVKVIKIKRT